ncbi:hypothetical protein LV476_05250 [Guyparkeria hydrothermalis]|uniref:hypothetical protein n=1 Tax=Guyparkeria hydrothermalis TaxID=923 RepID=UPI0020225CEA|nr:hypothetical protein [Guyparkeria hydrothermalis]MCL7744358.1 hypothetical protein [Guyparkeria hydrothermalis]
MSRMAEADRAGTKAETEAPRELIPEEKALIARYCRRRYGSTDQEIADTIQDCEGCPPFREYLVTLASQ